MEKQHSGRSSFSGKLGFVLSAAGASVGLGNIWRFPYLAAKYGGATLVAPYALAHLKRYEHIEQLSWTSWMTETSLVEYVEQIGKRPWPSMEHAIAKDIELLRRYMQATQRPFGPDGELEVFASDEAATAYYHTLSGYRRALSGASRCCWPLHMPSILRC